MKTEKLMTVGVQVLLGALILISLLLLRQNLGLHKELKYREPDVLNPGESVESFVAPSFSGELSISYGPTEKAKVFLYLSPRCGYCSEQMPYWHQIIEGIDRERYEVFTVARDSETLENVSEYLEAEHLDPIPTVLAPPRVWRRYKFFGTPTTLVVSKEGAVVKQWRGVWGLEWRNEASKILRMKFYEPASPGN